MRGVNNVVLWWTFFFLFSRYTCFEFRRIISRWRFYNLYLYFIGSSQTKNLSRTLYIYVFSHFISLCRKARVNWIRYCCTNQYDALCSKRISLFFLLYTTLCIAHLCIDSYQLLRAHTHTHTLITHTDTLYIWHVCKKNAILHNSRSVFVYFTKRTTRFVL